MRYTPRLLFLTLSLLALNASAQWSWVDQNGRRIFSDRAPPNDIPAQNIVKRPGRTIAAPADPDTQASPAGQSPSPSATTPQLAASVAKPSGVDPALAERKKKDELAQKTQSVAEQERLFKQRFDNCERAKLAKKGLDSGIRIAKTNASGEREIMDEAARAAESQRIQAVIESDCK